MQSSAGLEALYFGISTLLTFLLEVFCRYNSNCVSQSMQLARIHVTILSLVLIFLSFSSQSGIQGSLDYRFKLLIDHSSVRSLHCVSCPDEHCSDIITYFTGTWSRSWVNRPSGHSPKGSAGHSWGWWMWRKPSSGNFGDARLQSEAVMRSLTALQPYSLALKWALPTWQLSDLLSASFT